MTPLWEPGTQYNVGDIVVYEGNRYKNIQAHRSQGDWTPPVTPALWGRLVGGDEEQPEGVREEPKQQPEQQPAQHWWETDEHKKQLEIGGGLLVGALGVGAGYVAYKQHQKHEAEREAQIDELTHWIKEAQARTEAFYRDQSDRMAWVLNRGLVPPEGAIESGRDEKGQVFYVARVFHEGGIHPGRASPSLRKGGQIGYARQTIEVDTYEVLIGDPTSVKWVDHTELGFQDSPRPVEAGHDSRGALLYIAQAEHRGGVYPGKAGGQSPGAFVLVDDTEVHVHSYRVLCYA